MLDDKDIIIVYIIMLQLEYQVVLSTARVLMIWLFLIILL